MCSADGADPLRLARCIYIRRQGDGFMVTVEPHPEGHSLNRRFSTHAAASGWAQGTQERKSWPIVDEAVVDKAGFRDPGRTFGRPRVHIDQNSAGNWIVKVTDRPWGMEAVDVEFFDFNLAKRAADLLRERLRKIDADHRRYRARKRGRGNG